MSSAIHAISRALISSALKRPRPTGAHRGKHRKKKSGPPPPSRFRFPSERDVATFAAELGMDLEFDSEQRWLVDQALSSELPPLWNRLYNPTARAYYVRAPTKAEPKEIVTWVHPLVPAYSTCTLGAGGTPRRDILQKRS